MEYKGPLAGIVSQASSVPGAGTRPEHPSLQQHKERHVADAMVYEGKGKSKYGGESRS